MPQQNTSYQERMARHKSEVEEVKKRLIERILEALESPDAGSPGWTPPWRRHARLRNPCTDIEFSFMNCMLLYDNAQSEEDREARYWATEKQWLRLGCRPKEGARPIKALNPIERGKGRQRQTGVWAEDRAQDPSTNQAFMLVDYYPISQVEPKPQIQLDDDIVESLKLVEMLAKANRIEIVESNLTDTQGKLKACFNHATDQIQMPPKDHFVDANGHSATSYYYSILLHEMVHWTGHHTRLRRSEEKRKSRHERMENGEYPFEELVAEFGAVQLGLELSIASQFREDQVAYLASWVRNLKNEAKYLADADKRAQKAVSFLLANLGLHVATTAPFENGRFSRRMLIDAVANELGLSGESILAKKIVDALFKTDKLERCGKQTNRPEGQRGRTPMMWTVRRPAHERLLMSILG